MKSIILAATICLIGANAFAAGDLARTDPRVAGAGTPINGWAPDPAKSVLVTSTASRNFDQKVKGAENLAWSFTNTGGDCKGRIMKDTTRASWPQFTIYGGTSVIYVNHRNTAFANISGCIGDYKAQ